MSIEEGKLIGEPHQLEILPNPGDPELYYVPGQSQTQSQNPMYQLPVKHIELSNTINPMNDAFHILEDILLKYYNNPDGHHHKLLQKTIQSFKSLCYIIEEDYKEEVGDDFHHSVYHPVKLA
jgi:hypothetical protein